MAQPVLLALLLADHLYRDADTNKFVICGVFDKLYRLQKPARAADAGRKPGPIELSPAQILHAGNPSVYVCLTECNGRMEFKLQYVDLSDQRVYFAVEFEIDCKDPLETVQLGLPLPPLPTPHDGFFALELMHDGAMIGSRRVAVIQHKVSEE